MRSCGVLLRAGILPGLLVVIAAPAAAQPPPGSWMIGGDLGVNFNLFSSPTVLSSGMVLPDFERSFLGAGSGTGLSASISCAVPTGAQHMLLRLSLEEFHVRKEGTVVIPCELYDATGKPQSISQATTNQRYDLSMSALTLGAMLEAGSGRLSGTAGLAGGMHLTGRFRWSSEVITPDSCFYNFFTAARSHRVSGDNALPGLLARFPITLGIAYLIPAGSRVFLAPGITLDLGLVPFDAGGATMTTIRPAVGVRYVP